MDAKTCLEKLGYVGVLSFATVDRWGAPQVRCVSAVHYEPEALYFFTARGKDFCRELERDGRVQVMGYTKYKEMIRLSGRAEAVPETERTRWMDTIFSEQPYLANVYPHPPAARGGGTPPAKPKSLGNPPRLSRRRTLPDRLAPGGDRPGDTLPHPTGELPALRRLRRGLPGRSGQAERGRLP